MQSVQDIGPYQTLPLRGRVDLGLMAMTEYSASPIIGLFSVISSTFVGEVLPFCRKAVSVFYSPSRLGWERKDFTPLLRCSRYTLLQPLPTGPQETRWWGSHHSCRDAVGVFIYNTLWESLSRLQRCSRCLLLQHQATGPLVGSGLTTLSEMQSESSSTATADWTTLGESYPSAKTQSVSSSTTLAFWATLWGSLSRLQRCSRCLLQHQATGSLVGGGITTLAEMQSESSSTAPADWTTLGESYLSAKT